MVFKLGGILYILSGSFSVDNLTLCSNIQSFFKILNEGSKQVFHAKLGVRLSLNYIE